MWKEKKEAAAVVKKKLTGVILFFIWWLTYHFKYCNTIAAKDLEHLRGVSRDIFIFTQ